MSDYEQDIENLLFLIKKYCPPLQGERISNLIEEDFNPKFIFSELTKMKIASIMNEKDLILYKRILLKYI